MQIMTEERFIPHPEPEREAYFRKLLIAARTELKIHQDAGLWGEKGSKEDWRNVTEHCAVEAARVGVIGELVGLSPDVQQDLATAAWLHDAGKKEELALARSNGMSFESFVISEQRARERLTTAGYSDRIVRLSTSVGVGVLSETETILAKPSLSDDDTAFLIMHYIDDITSDSKSIRPAEFISDGTVINDLDRRIDKNQANQNYTRLNEEGKEHFSGKSSFQMQREIGHKVEDRLFTLLRDRGVANLPDASIHLPEFIEEQVNYKIYR